MLLERKNAIIYGGGGAIGSAVARAFAAEGARVYLAGRTLEKLEKAAEVIRRAGGQAHTAQLDALDEQAGLPHAPWPPVYPKMPGEPRRVAPSRARKVP